MPEPWTPHALTLTFLVAGVAAYIWCLRRLAPLYAPAGRVVTRGQILAFAGSMVAFGVALSWPLADLAQHASATAHVVQQLLLVLVVPPLFLLGLPRWLLELATRGSQVEKTLRRLTHPVVAFLVFNVALVLAWLPPVIWAEGTWAPVAAVVNAFILGAGFMMWIPALRIVPGTRHLSAASRITYLFAQSVVFNFPAMILVFVSYPLYSVYAHHVRRALGLGPLADQQLAGGVAKVVGFAVLLGAAALILHQGWRAEETGRDPDPLFWEEVARELRRLEGRSKGSTDTG